MRRKRLMTLMHLFLIHRYQAASVHYLTPNDDNHRQAQRMLELGIFGSVNDEVGQILVADVNTAVMRALVDPARSELEGLITGA